MKYYYIYKITNNLNNRIYIGCKGSNSLNDGYMGSSKYLKADIDKFGINNFTKEILSLHDSYDKLLLEERRLVTRDFVKREDTYNKSVGGKRFTQDLVVVRDITTGENLVVNKCDYGKDDRYEALSVVVRDKTTNKVTKITKSTYRNSDNYQSINTGKVTCQDKSGNILRVSVTDSRYISGELSTLGKGYVTVKDSQGNSYKVSKNDPRYLSGEFVGTFKGLSHSEDAKRKIGSKNSIHQKGKGNSMYGMVWIHNLELKKSKRIQKDKLEDFLEKNPTWKKGRKMKF